MKLFTVLLLCAAAIWVSAMSSDASAYEFHLLNGMVMKGALSSFSDGVFHVDTDFGSVAVDADKLDYIIVEECDPGPKARKGECEQLGVGLAPAAGGASGAAPVGAGAGVPQVAPDPLSGIPAGPPPVGSWSITSQPVYPGTFRGGAE